MKAWIKNIIPVLPLLFYLCISNGQDNWIQKADFSGGGRTNAVSFSIGNRGFVGTGYFFDTVTHYAFHNDFWEYYPQHNVWKQKTNVGGAVRNGAVGFSIGNKGYIGLGNGAASDFWAYDTASETWAPLASLPAATRRGAVGFAIGNKGYVGLGTDDYGNVFTDFWEYDPALNKWTRKADFPGNGRYGPVGFSIGNKGFVGTGVDTANDLLADFWEYDTAANKWRARAPMPESRSGAIGFSIANLGYVGFGYVNYQGISNDMWAYDTAANAWTEMASCDTSYTGDAATSFVIGNKAYVGTGLDYHGRYVSYLWQYTNHTAGIDLPVNHSLVTIYPNPNTGRFTINGIVKAGYFKICSMDGKTVYSGSMASISQSLNLDLKLSNGLYVLKLFDNDGVTMHKFIVENE